MTVRNRIQPGDGDARHGTANAYRNHGCRCDACTAANREYQRDYLRRHPEQRWRGALVDRLRYEAKKRAAP